MWAKLTFGKEKTLLKFENIKGNTIETNELTNFQEWSKGSLLDRYFLFFCQKQSFLNILKNRQLVVSRLKKALQKMIMSNIPLKLSNWYI